MSERNPDSGRGSLKRELVEGLAMGTLLGVASTTVGLWTVALAPIFAAYMIWQSYR